MAEDSAFGTQPGHEIDPLLRALERRLLRLAAQGVETAEMARRFRRSPAMIDRIFAMIPMHRFDLGPVPAGDVLRPIERRVLRWRANGEGFDAIASRFKKTPDYIRQVEAMAHHKLKAE